MAEGAALEMPCTGNCTVGSNPTPSAITFEAASWNVGGTWGRRVRRGQPSAPTKQMVPYRPPASLAVLDGEVAVPCSPQSAIAGLNPLSRAARVE